MSDLIFRERDGLSKKSLKLYESNYRVLKNMNGVESDSWLTSSSEGHLLTLIHDNYENKNTQRTYLSLCILIRKMNGRKTDLLVRDMERIKKANEVFKEEKKEELKRVLPSYEEVDAFVNKPTLDDVKFIVNHLLWNSCVRNQDLNMKIVEKEEDAVDTNMNYLIVMKTRCKIITNVFKTSFAYGQKSWIETSRPFLKHAKSLLEKKQTYLLERKNKSAVDMSNIPYYLKKLLYEGLTETDYCKMRVTHIVNSGDKINEKLTVISYRRGTNVAMLMSDYLLS